MGVAPALALLMISSAFCLLGPYAGTIELLLGRRVAMTSDCGGRHGHGCSRGGKWRAKKMLDREVGSRNVVTQVVLCVPRNSKGNTLCIGDIAGEDVVSATLVWCLVA